jgi:hypothetical protein
MVRRWLTVMVGTGCLVTTFAGGYAWTSRPATYQSAVLEVLNHHHIPYTSVDIRPICLPDPTCLVGDGTRTFSTVVLQNGGTSYGLITCYDRRGDCYLDIVTLGVQRLPLRDLRSVRFLPKPLARIWQRGAVWLRGRLEYPAH